MKKTGIRLSLAALLFLAGCKGGTSSLSMTEVSSVPASSAPASSVVPVEKVTCIFQNYDNSELWRTKIDPSAAMSPMAERNRRNRIRRRRLIPSQAGINR
jgi:hypothetical protein